MKALVRYACLCALLAPTVRAESLVTERPEPPLTPGPVEPGPSAVAPSAVPSAAESADRARAAGLAGLAAFERAAWTEALSAFVEAEGHMHSPVFLLYAARAENALGHAPEARALYSQILAELRLPDPPPAWLDAQRNAELELADVEKKLERLVLPLDVPALSPVGPDPGSTEPSAPPVATQRSIRPAPPAALDADPTTAGSSWRPRHKAAVTAFGVGGLGLLAGSLTGGLAFEKAADIKSRCNGSSCRPEDEARAGEARTLADGATVSFIMAGAGAAIGLTLWFWPTAGEPGSIAIHVGPSRVDFSGRF